MALTFRASTLSQASSGYSARGAPQLAPALLTSTCSSDSRSASAAASPSLPAWLERSAGSARQVPDLESSAATWLQASALREEM
jgi:hypothetical protein